MDTYGRVFAQLYNACWSEFSQKVAPRILDYYEHAATSPSASHVLDLCCGTGQLAALFLQRGYRVTCLDQSPHMLDHARQNTVRYAATGQVKFVQADAAQFKLNDFFGLVVSTFDSLNHLPSEDVLCKCFQSVFSVTAESGLFVFDLNTRKGLRNERNGIEIRDTGETVIITRQIYDGESKTIGNSTGFVRTDNGLYERFEEIISITAFELHRVRAALLETGFREAYFAHETRLDTTVDDPESLDRVFVVASK